jgi:hypothetical protein
MVEYERRTTTDVVRCNVRTLRTYGHVSCKLVTSDVPEAEGCVLSFTWRDSDKRHEGG